MILAITGLANFFFTVVFVFLSAYIPGRTLITRMHLDRDEKFVISFGVSIFIYYLLAFSFYILKLNAILPFAFYAIMVSCIFILIRSLFKNKDEYQKEFLMLIFLFIALLLLVAYQTLLPFYSGGGLIWDWFEHYQRTLFFLKSWPAYTIFGRFILPARPPLFNLSASVFLNLLGDSYYNYQIVSTLFNLLPLSACFLFIKKYSVIKIKSLFPIVIAFFLLNPTFIYHATYPWTKFLTSYFILLALYFFFKGNKNNYLYSFFFGAISIITHYSAIPFISVIFLFFFVKSILHFKIYYKYFIISTVILVTICSTWFIWSFNIYGLKNTLLSNSSYNWQESLSLRQIIDNKLSNMKYLFSFNLEPNYAFNISLEKPLLRLYDNLFSLYIQNIVAASTFTLTISCVFIFIIFRKYKLLTYPKIITILKKYSFIFLIILLAVLTDPGGDQALLVFLLPLSFLLTSFFIIQILENKLSRWAIIMVILFLVFEAGLEIILRVYATEFELGRSLRFNSYTSMLLSHLNEYNLKVNNHLVFLFDHFYNLYSIFILICLFGWGFLIYYLSKGLLNNSKRRD